MIAAEQTPTTITNNIKEVPAEVKTMLSRLDEIKAIDKSSEKKKHFVEKFALLNLS